ncbi:hypothetical protein [Paenibacillus cymbidii]|uniref:hypothetical protein n=1 Tax=Paenibacillus cymbidii TaxID=1639034 RepID=UPI0010810958|nr:hypothetical protein [Paenibacillus cymbidii]
MNKRWVCATVLVLLLAVLAGCGGSKTDVPIFIMPNSGMAPETARQLEQSLQGLIGEKPTVSVQASPLFNLQKLMVEIAAGDNGIVIVPRGQFVNFALQGSLVVLDDVFDPALYPDGVITPEPDPKKPDVKPGMHLYGVPVTDAKWLKDAGYQGEVLYALVLPRAPQVDAAKQVLSSMIGK